MRALPSRRPRYAEVTATLALVIALGGTSYAVTALPRNSVGTAQLKAHAVTRGKLARGLAHAGRRGRKGVPGPAGAIGPAGPAGPSGMSGLAIVDNGGTLGAATCPAGKRAIGGGAHATGGNGNGVLVSSEPTSDGRGWTATAAALSGTVQPGVLIYAICAVVT
jgi:hypothetical protein